ncbi:MAG: PleD family two-component system response regulator [Acetobacteraceae bacterium]|nr:PleD family two-component system response regulator [Acetobacteraceae bacterium]
MTARILVVDDIATNLRLLEAKLQNEYYDVLLANSGPEALTQAVGWAPDVILLDIMMPGMDGYEVCERLKADPRTAHIPVVMVTALVDPAERVRGLHAGADDFLSKPVDDATLFARLRALLRVKQVQDAWRIQGEAARGLGFRAPAEPSLDLRHASVLVLSADPADHAEVQAALSADGVTVRGADTPAEARALLAGGLHELAVLVLPEDGGETLRLASRLRADAATRDLPVLLVAATGQRGLVLRGFDIGANDHVFRPIDPHELRARARNQIRRKRYQERLRDDLDRSLEAAVTDPLTGLRNRRYAMRHLGGLLHGGEAAILLIDVDHFKAINDRHGHPAGDEVLRQLTRRLTGQLRAADVISRHGGEEFLVVLASEPADYAEAVAERLREAMCGAPFMVAGSALQVTVSIGLVVAQQGWEPEAAIAAADAALYRAKSAGRNRVEFACGTDLPAAEDSTAGA